MKISFQILTGKHKGRMLTLPADVVKIGRDPTAQIRVNSTEVSRIHCEITLRDGNVYVKDLGSRNGTFVNGEVIFGEAQIRPGDTLHVGNMVFELAGEKKKAAPKSSERIRPPGSRNAIRTASEEDVIDWLAEDESELDSDTTIVTNTEARQMGLNDAPGPSAPLVPRTSSISLSPVEDGTPAADAAQIIKQYWANK
ncbi:FHA domain-containing protein [Rubinisphaera margarita]|uniref:FHA domain-containing protein n=1 Tax=Rubinisphaera margarita TaxID=2909586 RepID=UPI001EE836E3|nr:FHA domain-containing protein [Rubinisphaera margarita]MCG6157061.1 FHA domain-containing protein [Rubinisphaera margarita]